ncbi:MAG TPA: hypothetical protein VGJ53_05560 [Micromonosporaceae bacterium]|jgi:hypothetical protein
MVGEVTRRAVVGGMVGGIAAVVIGLPLVATPALAAGPTSVTISGRGLAEPLTIRKATYPELFSALLSQVSWLATARGHAAPLAADKRGPKYTVVVLVKDAPKQTYDLYPLALGGPRAYRPAKQPDGHDTTSAWIYAKLTMPQTLIAAGVPLPDTPDVITGGLGGGEGGVNLPGSEDTNDLDHLLGRWRVVTLLNGGVVLVIAMGLAGISFLIRRKV